MLFLSLISLSLIVVLCSAAIFSGKFNENWLQMLGLIGVALWAVARFYQLLDGGWLSTQQTFVYVSMALYALGTAKKVLFFSRKLRAQSIQSH